MSCYFLAQITIRDHEKYREYLSGFDEIFKQYRGKVEVVDEAPIVLEGSWPCTRTVLIKFPDVAEAKRWYNSSEYQKLAQFRLDASSANIVLVSGRE